MLEGAHFAKEERRQIREAGNEAKKRELSHRKIKLICQKVFKHSKVKSPSGKVLHLGRLTGMNCAKDNNVAESDTTAVSGHKSGDGGSRTARDYYFTCSPPVTMHVLSGGQANKDWKVRREICDTFGFDKCLHTNSDNWMQQHKSEKGDHTDACNHFLHEVTPNDQRVIAQDCE